MSQTNNADFGGSDENLHSVPAPGCAIETGHAVVNVSTVGTSQVIGPDGTVMDGVGVDRAAARVTTVPVRTGLTPASILGPWITASLGWGS